VKAGVIGIGRWGSKVAREYVALLKEGVIDSLVLCDIDVSKLKPFSGMAKKSCRIDETLKLVDVIHVCAPNSLHYEIARKALESGVHVLVEKPMAEDINHAFELVELSMSKGLVLKVGHIFRFANIVRKIRQFYKNNWFGKLYYFNLEWTHLIPPIENVDVIYDLLPHPLDIINFITGKWPLRFTGIGRVFRRNKMAEDAFIQMIYDSFVASTHVSWVVPIRRRKLEIVGSKRSIVADCVKQTAIVYDESGFKEIYVKPNNTIRDEILNFLENVKTGKIDYNSSIIGTRTIEMIEQARKSIRIVR